LDRLIAAGKLNVSSVTGSWERYRIQAVKEPFPGIPRALVIAGSDRRGTAFGIFSVSETIGVSPWVWWADVAPEHRDSLSIDAGPITSTAPSVKYRGIFINDEDWGLQPWAAKTFEPELGDIGPKTYAKVCELLLRLKANYLWPAMHPCTKAFNRYPQNKLVADDHAIVMGSSHCEQMLRNNVTEYDEKRGPWDYDKNSTNILNYWKQRLEENGKFENVYTLGMRGIHDSAMPGGGTTAQKVARLQGVINDQRDLITDTLGSDPSKVPQIFCPYKEVLTLYQNGLKVPDDVTLVWPDDNFGYIRQLSNPDERKRSGGAGVYYHISYWGAPEDYLWLDTTPPALIWEEMRKAYDYGARNVWIVNVGDIKPGEIGMDFFLRMAWNVEQWNENAQPIYLADWAERNFGRVHAAAVAAVLDEYYRLNYACRPEHLHLAGFTKNYNEISDRLIRFAKLVRKAEDIYTRMPAEKKDAYYELVLYPVRGSSLANQMHLGGSGEQASRAYEQIQSETKFYNERVANGKWRNMMSSNPRSRPALKKPIDHATVSSENAMAAAASDQGFVSIEAEHSGRRAAPLGTEWKVISGLGRSGDAIALLPSSTSDLKSAALEYEFTSATTSAVQVVIHCIPTQPVYPPVRERYSVSIDSGEAKVIDIATAERSRDWSTNVLRAAAIHSSTHTLNTAGRHTLKLQPLDPGLVFDKIVIDLGGLKPSYLGPSETKQQ
jgi:hypothetical protein